MEQLNMRLKMGKKAAYRAQAEKRGMSLQAYIIHLIEEDMKKDET